MEFRTGLQRLTACILHSVRHKQFTEPDFIIGDPIDPYMFRWYITPKIRWLPKIYLHKFWKSDDDRALHDHPWMFYVSLILQGSYKEMTQTGVKRYKAGTLLFRWGKSPHRIIVDENEWHRPMTIFFAAPHIRTWGFYCKKGWIPWYDFVKPTAKGEVGRGCGEMD